MHKPLEDWRVGDIALCPDGVERTIHERNDKGCYWVLSEEHADSFWKQTDMMEMQRPLQNPVFLVGDLVRGRYPHAQGKWRWFQMDVDGSNPDRFVLVERAPVKEKPDGVRVWLDAKVQPPPITVLCQNDEDVP